MLRENIRAAKALVAVALAFAMVGCALFGLHVAPESPAARAFALAATRDLEAGNQEALTKRLAPNIRQLGGQFAAMRAFLPQGAPRTEHVVFSFSTNKSDASGTHHFDRYTIEVSDGHAWALVRCEVVDADKSPQLDAFYVQQMFIPYAKLVRFSLADATLAGICVLALGIFAFFTTVTAWVVLWRSTAFSRKWPWAIAIGLSFTQFDVRWIDGVWNWKPLAFIFFGFGGGQMNDNPWAFGAGFPVFAIWVILRDRRARRQSVGEYF